MRFKTSLKGQTMVFLLSLFLFPGLALAQNDCIRIKAAFDIGSGATKLKVARVNQCEKRIEEVFLSTSRPVAYRQALEVSEDNKLDKAILEKGGLALQELKELASKFGPASYYAVATSAFRTANNGEKAIAYLSQKANVEIEVITQKREAYLGHLAAISNRKIEKNKGFLVWDIGGGSMQMSFSEKNDYYVYEGKLASVSFKNHIIQKVKEVTSPQVTSPNPIGATYAQVAKQDAMTVARFTVPTKFKEKIRNGAKVLGIGGVHNFSIVGQLNNKEYNLENLEHVIAESVHKTDDEIASEYAETEVSNLILVSAFMEELGIASIKALDINLADGVLLLE